MDETLKKINEAIKEIRPALLMEGGDVEVVEFRNRILKIKLLGACGDCPMSMMTLKAGIERYIKSKVPEVLEVQEVQT